MEAQDSRSLNEENGDEWKPHGSNNYSGQTVFCRVEQVDKGTSQASSIIITEKCMVSYVVLNYSAQAIAVSDTLMIKEIP